MKIKDYTSLPIIKAFRKLRRYIKKNKHKVGDILLFISKCALLAIILKSIL